MEINDVVILGLNVLIVENLYEYLDPAGQDKIVQARGDAAKYQKYADEIEATLDQNNEIVTQAIEHYAVQLIEEIGRILAKTYPDVAV